MVEFREILFAFYGRMILILGSCFVFRENIWDFYCLFYIVWGWFKYYWFWFRNPTFILLGIWVFSVVFFLYRLYVFKFDYNYIDCATRRMLSRWLDKKIIFIWKLNHPFHSSAERKFRPEGPCSISINSHSSHHLFCMFHYQTQTYFLC